MKMTKATRAFNAEFERMKPIIRARSGGRCEAPRIANDYLVIEPDECTEEALEALHEFLSWHKIYCTGRAAHVHHRKYRGKSRGGTNAESNLADVSLKCHEWIHAHGGFGEKANLIGLALSANQSEELGTSMEAGF